MSFKDEARRRRMAEKRGRRGARRASAMQLRQVVLHPVVVTPEDSPAVCGMRASVVIVDEFSGADD